MAEMKRWPVAGCERQQRPPGPREPWQRGEDDGPSRPDVQRPDTQELLRRMRRVDPRQARRYRQRSGQ
ncbi:MAG TPA: ubiquitin-like protein UBact [Armatimonadota bacterium]|nr:ubiquitin-like protein UBact [Armatimonadota bacterium]